MSVRKALVVLIAGIVGVAGCALSAPQPSGLQAGAPQGQPAAAEVKIDNFSFGPAALTVAAGTTVTWVNHDDIPHNVQSTDKLFKSKVMDTDEKFSFTFAKAGEYPYFCGIHPKMTGKVIVK